jgi:nucleotide-binding universal stress UspA family protein
LTALEEVTAITSGDWDRLLLWLYQGAKNMPTAQIETPVAVHKILIATDFTEASRKAFKYAKAFARHFQASVTTAHVLRASTNDWPKFGGNPEYKKLWHDTRRNLDGLVRQLKQAGFEAEQVLLEGDPVEGVLNTVKRNHVDLLIVGTHGSRDFERFVLGSIAEEILRNAPCPVLTVGTNVHDPHHGEPYFRHILLATTLSPEARASARYALSLAAEESAHISICHVLPEGHIKTSDSTKLEAELTESLRKFIPEDILKKCATRYAVKYGNAADEILELAAKQKVDLIVLGARSASGIATHLAPGVAFRVIAGAPCPVLTIRE